MPTPRTKLAPVVVVAGATKGDEESGIEESDDEDSHKKSSDKSGDDDVDGDRSDREAKHSEIGNKIEVLFKY